MTRLSALRLAVGAAALVLAGWVGWGCAGMAIASAAAQEVFHPWTGSRPPAVGDVWKVTVNSGETFDVVLGPTPDCKSSGLVAYTLRGQSDNAIWGRLVVTESTVHAFLQHDTMRRIWYLKSQAEKWGRMILQEATRAEAPPGGVTCNILPAPAGAGAAPAGGGRGAAPNPGFIPPSVPGARGQGASQVSSKSWNPSPRIYSLGIAVSDQLEGSYPTRAILDEDLLRTTSFASGVFERFVGFSVCGAVLPHAVEQLKPEGRGDKTYLRDVIKRFVESAKLKAPWSTPPDLRATFIRKGDSDSESGGACDPMKNMSTVVHNGVPVWDMWVLAHELAHQFTATHTFEQKRDDRVIGTAFEPDLGLTELAYPAGQIVGHWFHAKSVAQILDGQEAALKKFSSCGRQTSSLSAPLLRLQGDSMRVPFSTPFSITVRAQADAPDRDWLIWHDDATGDTNDEPKSPPFFQAMAPTANTERSFPSLESLLAEAPNSRPLTSDAKIMIMARDARGRVGMATDTIQMIGGSTFAVSTPVGWVAGKKDNELKWETAGTEYSPFDEEMVNVSLYDGKTWIPIAQHVKNDGREEICILASEAGPDMRVRISAEVGSFFAVSPRFTIAPAAGASCTR